MGKRIPGKKHRGVKDPLLQKALREESLKHHINAPPKEIDDQEIPKSVERLMKLKQMTKDGVFDKQRKKNKNKSKLMDTARLMTKEKLFPGMSRPDRNLPELVQRPGETDRAFLHRVNTATYDFIKEVNFEVKHNMKMKKDEKTGEVKFDKVELDPVEKMFKDKLQETQKHKRKKSFRDPSMEGLSKTARRRLKLQAKLEMRKKMEGEKGDDNEFDKLQDKVEFNEVVHRPPQLTALPKKAAASDIARRPASKPGLLLTKMLTMSSDDGQRRDLTGRRRDLSLSDRRRLDTAQATAVQAYRQLKAKRSTTLR